MILAAALLGVIIGFCMGCLLCLQILDNALNSEIEPDLRIHTNINWFEERMDWLSKR